MLIVAREVWHDLLWAARPAVVVADDGTELVHWSPAGTIGCFATSRFFPGRDHLPREERQLVSLETRQWHYRGIPARGAKLAFVSNVSWASVEVTWNRNGSFAHWYVNFQRPIKRTSKGYDTLDLVIDIVVGRDWRWAWKDEEPFRNAIRRGIFGEDVEAAITAEAERVQAQIDSREGPFDAKWIDWTPPSGWPTPCLPDDFANGANAPAGATITLSPDQIT
jgi:protein associated with RNAse G/E